MMDLGLSPPQIAVALGAAKAVASADGSFEQHERELVDAARKALGHEGSLDAIRIPSPEAVADALPERADRERLVQALLLVAMMDGEVKDTELAAVRTYAAALGVDEPAITDLARVARGHTTIVKYDLLRRSGMVQTAARAAWEAKGWKGLWTMVGSIYGLDTDADMAMRYKRLGLLPEGTFGRAYWAHMTERGFSFPGEVKGFPEELVKHDLAHVLGGYDTDPTGECEVVAFISGFMKTDPFGYLFMIFLHMQLGVHIFEGTPIEHLKIPAERVVRALERGRRVTRDLYDPSWSYWDDFPRPIAEVRAGYGIAA
jgi:tellurite resistance protein